MEKSSINFKPLKATSYSHSNRACDLDYNRKDLTIKNERYIIKSIEDKEREIRAFCKKATGRKMQKNAQPIREAVVNMKKSHSMDDLKRLADTLKTSFGIECFQIYIHRDEGRWESTSGFTYKDSNGKNYVGSEPPEATAKWIPNRHAHMLFDWQEKELNKYGMVKIRGKYKNTLLTGRTKKYNRADLSKIQDLVADTLQMERGEMRVNSNTERLEAVEYKRKKAEEEYSRIRQIIERLNLEKKSLLEEIENLNKHPQAQKLKALEKKYLKLQFQLKALNKKLFTINQTKEIIVQKGNDVSKVLTKDESFKKLSLVNKLKEYQKSMLREGIEITYPAKFNFKKPIKYCLAGVQVKSGVKEIPSAKSLPSLRTLTKWISKSIISNLNDAAYDEESIELKKKKRKGGSQDLER